MSTKQKILPINIRLDKRFVRDLKAAKKLHKDGKWWKKRLLNASGRAKLEELNGFAEHQMNHTDFIDNFIDKKTVADATIDGNANVGTKDICSLMNEMNKPHLKLLVCNKIYYELCKQYGEDVAHKWFWGEWLGYSYLHDEYEASLKPYCWAADVRDVVEKGLFFSGRFNAQPPQHLTTYTDFVVELVCFQSNRSSGACGLPSFLIYSYYFWKKDCNTGYSIKSPEYYRDQEFQRVIYKLNQNYIRQNQTAFTNFNIFDRPYLEELFGGRQYPDGSYVIDYIDDIIEYQKAFMRVVSKIRQANVMTFPVLTYSLLRKDGKFVDEDFAKWCCRHNMEWGDSNFFIDSDVTSLSSCCRLQSDIKKLAYFNSIGGSALEVGSVKVNTINLARIAYESASKEEYFEKLRDQTKLCCQVLDVVRHIIQRNVEKGLLPNYTLGVMNMRSQYMTVGFTSLYETIQHFGLTTSDAFGNTFYSDEGLEFAKEILKVITEVKDEFSENRDYSINLEQIPGERAATVLMEKDKLFHPDEKYDLPLYGNQFVPLGTKTTLHERIRLNAALDKACSGGSIMHVGCDSPIQNFETAWNLLNYIADAGVKYFAFNMKINSCEHNHGFYGETCPVCGGKAVATWSRIVGFLTPTDTYSKERKAEFKMRDWMDLNAMEEM